MVTVPLTASVCSVNVSGSPSGSVTQPASEPVTAMSSLVKLPLETGASLTGLIVISTVAAALVPMPSLTV